MIDDLKAFGAPQDVIDSMRERAPPAVYEVWPENMETLRVFLALQSSWDWLMPAMGAPARIGIRSTEIESTVRMMGIRKKRRRSVLRDIRTMEQAALDVLSERRR